MQQMHREQRFNFERVIGQLLEGGRDAGARERRGREARERIEDQSFKGVGPVRLASFQANMKLLFVGRGAGPGKKDVGSEL